MVTATLGWERRRQYIRATTLATYYRWCASRWDTLPGGDPITGQPRRRGYNSGAEGEGHAAYLAMARYWLAQARAWRGAR